MVIIANGFGEVPYRTADTRWSPGDVPEGQVTLNLSQYALERLWNRAEWEGGFFLTRVALRLYLSARFDLPGGGGTVLLEAPGGGLLEWEGEVQKNFHRDPAGERAGGEWQMSLTNPPCRWRALTQSGGGPPPASNVFQRATQLAAYHRSIDDERFCPLVFEVAPVVLPRAASNPRLVVTVSADVTTRINQDAITTTVGPAESEPDGVMFRNYGIPVVFGPAPVGSQ